MATEYHLTPEGPRRCSVDRSNPRSRGCPLGGTHFDSYEDAMEVYTEDLQKTFGDFHVLVRASSKERIRRVGYRSLDGIERAKASPQVKRAVSNLKAASTRARSALAELQGRYRGEAEADSQRSSTLPETVATEPLAEMDGADSEAEELSERTFSTGEAETMASFGARMMANSNEASFSMAPLDRSEIDRAIANIEARDMIRKTPAPKRPDRIKAYRSAKKRRVAIAKVQTRSAISSSTATAKRRLSDAGYAVKATASVARETAELQARVAAGRLQDGAQDIGSAAQRRAKLMSLPAGHIRPGDTFDGTTVRAVELVGNGKVKISYQAKPGGPVLAATVPGDRSMSVDRRTRREARNTRISSKIARPVAQTRGIYERVAKASEDQLSLFGSILQRDQRMGAVDRSIRQHERRVRERELIQKLKDLRSPAANRALQNS